MHRLRDFDTEVLQHELNGINEPKDIYYQNEFHIETKRDFNSFKPRNFLSDERNKNFEELTTSSKNLFPFKVHPILQLNPLSDITIVEDFSSQIVFHKFLNQTYGVVYLKNCEFNEELNKN